MKYGDIYQNVTQKHEVSKCYWKNGADKNLFNEGLPQAFNLFFFLNAISKKCDVAKYNIMSYAYSFYYNVNM